MTQLINHKKFRKKSLKNNIPKSIKVFRKINYIRSIFKSISLGVLLSPFFGSGFELWLVGLVQLSDFWHQRIVWVCVCQQWWNWQQNFWNCQGWWPLILQNVQTNWSVCVDVRVVNLCCEIDLWGSEWVISWKVDVQEENTSGIWAVIGADDSCLPMELVVFSGASWAVGWWFLLKVEKFLLDSFLGHFEVFI